MTSAFARAPALAVIIMYIIRELNSSLDRNHRSHLERVDSANSKASRTDVASIRLRLSSRARGITVRMLYIRRKYRVSLARLSRAPEHPASARASAFHNARAGPPASCRKHAGIPLRIRAVTFCVLFITPMLRKQRAWKTHARAHARVRALALTSCDLHHYFHF